MHERDCAHCANEQSSNIRFLIITHLDRELARERACQSYASSLEADLCGRNRAEMFDKDAANSAAEEKVAETLSVSKPSQHRGITASASVMQLFLQDLQGLLEGAKNVSTCTIISDSSGRSNNISENIGIKTLKFPQTSKDSSRESSVGLGNATNSTSKVCAKQRHHPCKITSPTQALPQSECEPCPSQNKKEKSVAPASNDRGHGHDCAQLSLVRKLRQHQRLPVNHMWSTILQQHSKPSSTCYHAYLRPGDDDDENCSNGCRRHNSSMSSIAIGCRKANKQQQQLHLRHPPSLTLPCNEDLLPGWKCLANPIPTNGCRGGGCGSESSNRKSGGKARTRRTRSRDRCSQQGQRQSHWQEQKQGKLKEQDECWAIEWKHDQQNHHQQHHQQHANYTRDASGVCRRVWTPVCAYCT